MSMISRIQSRRLLLEPSEHVIAPYTKNQQRSLGVFVSTDWRNLFLCQADCNQNEPSADWTRCDVLRLIHSTPFLSNPEVGPPFRLYKNNTTPLLFLNSPHHGFVMHEGVFFAYRQTKSLPGRYSPRVRGCRSAGFERHGNTKQSLCVWKTNRCFYSFFFGLDERNDVMEGTYLQGNLHGT